MIPKKRKTLRDLLLPVDPEEIQSLIQDSNTNMLMSHEFKTNIEELESHPAYQAGYEAGKIEAEETSRLLISNLVKLYTEEH